MIIFPYINGKHITERNSKYIKVNSLIYKQILLLREKLIEKLRSSKFNNNNNNNNFNNINNINNNNFNNNNNNNNNNFNNNKCSYPNCNNNRALNRYYCSRECGLAHKKK